jgi:hypothetical protein
MSKGVKMGKSKKEECEKLRDMILAERDKGNVVISTIEGLRVAKLSDIIKQPVEGLLWDLNRTPEVALTFIEDPKWINDFAVSLVIERLHEIAKDRL